MDQEEEMRKRGVKETCPACGMSKDEWPDPEGCEKDGQCYCCEGCADGSGCTCC